MSQLQSYILIMVGISRPLLKVMVEDSRSAGTSKMD